MLGSLNKYRRSNTPLHPFHLPYTSIYSQAGWRSHPALLNIQNSRNSRAAMLLAPEAACRRRNVARLIFRDNFAPLVNTLADWSGEDWRELKLMCATKKKEKKKAKPSGRLNAALIKMHIHIFPSSLSATCPRVSASTDLKLLPPLLLL